MEVTAFSLAQRFIGTQEVAGQLDNPSIMAMLKLDQSWPEHDEVPYCSAFVNYICWLLRLPRSKDLRARSWLGVGTPVSSAVVGYDVAVFWREELASGNGHVGFYAGQTRDSIQVLGGNQGNKVSVTPYPREHLLGYRRLYP